jgi:hypothetical protein
MKMNPAGVTAQIPRKTVATTEWPADGLMRRILFKKPGARPQDLDINLQDEAIRKLIGCTFETREFLGIAEPANAILICAHQETARALGYSEHIWLSTGSIAGPVIVTKLRDDHGDQYENLTNEDIANWTSRLLEFEERKEAHVHRSVTELEEKQLRREHYLTQAAITDDDFTAVMRMQAEIEQRLRERVQAKLRLTDRRLRKAEFNVPQLLVIGSALGAVPEQCCEIIEALATIRNNFAHNPGYFPGPAEIATLKRKAPECRPFTDLSFIETFVFSDRKDEGFAFSKETVALRVLYFAIILALDDEGIWKEELEATTAHL